MNEIVRTLQQNIVERLEPGKVLLLFGARRVGKTMLIKSIGKSFNGKSLLLNGEDMTTHAMLADKSIANYQLLFHGIDLLIIDEAQGIAEIGAKLKLIVDEIPTIHIIASGSSSFDLLNLTGEPLVGRSKTFYLFPFSQQEYMQVESGIEAVQNLESKLIYGTYPQLLHLNPSEKQEYLQDLVNGYLLKDILAIDGLRNSNKMNELLRLIALQSGNLVSFDELGRQLGLSKNTVEKYLDLLSKVFIIYRLGAFSNNQRKEISKSAKWYFYDNGIRNALISNFSPLSIRSDVGQLWESFVLSERLKRKYFNILPIKYYFWRTYDQQEIDLVEVQNQDINAFECKWSAKKAKVPIAFQRAYPTAQFSEINKENFLRYLTDIH